MPFKPWTYGGIVIGGNPGVDASGGGGRVEWAPTSSTDPVTGPRPLRPLTTLAVGAIGIYILKILPLSMTGMTRRSYDGCGCGSLGERKRRFFTSRIPRPPRTRPRQTLSAPGSNLGRATPDVRSSRWGGRQWWRGGPTLRTIFGAWLTRHILAYKRKPVKSLIVEYFNCALVINKHHKGLYWQEYMRKRVAPITFLTRTLLKVCNLCSIQYFLRFIILYSC